MSVESNIKELLGLYSIDYKEFEHNPIVNYEDAKREKSIHNWKWVESKNVFMTNKKWKYFLFVTTMWQKVDFKEMKKLLGEKLSIASSKEVEDTACCIPWCVSPFGLKSEIFTIIDEKIFDSESYLFSPWITTKTVQLKSKDLLPIFESLENKIFVN